jgi:hypothetical protein
VDASGACREISHKSRPKGSDSSTQNRQEMLRDMLHYYRCSRKDLSGWPLPTMSSTPHTGRSIVSHRVDVQNPRASTKTCIHATSLNCETLSLSLNLIGCWKPSTGHTARARYTYLTLNLPALPEISSVDSCGRTKSRSATEAHRGGVPCVRVAAQDRALQLAAVDLCACLTRLPRVPLLGDAKLGSELADGSVRNGAGQPNGLDPELLRVPTRLGQVHAKPDLAVRRYPSAH